MCAITKAVRDGRRTVVNRLIDVRVDVSIKDKEHHSPLFYASQAGDFKMVQLLVSADADIDDGSLHEAARYLHTDVVKFLMSHGHHAEYPCEDHEGRIPLAELCLLAQVDGPDSESRLRETMKPLFKVLDTTWTMKGKSILHLALDNKMNTYEVTRAVLHFEQIWKGASSGDTFLYQDRNGIMYSPTKYVEYLYEGTNAMKASLIQLLENKGFQTPRYYSPIGRQPENFCGVPEHIKVDIERQQRAEFELEETKRREREAHNEREHLAEVQHREALRRQHETEEQAKRQAKARQALELEQMHEKGRIAMDMQSAQALAIQRQRAQEADQQLRIASARSEAERKHKEQLLLMDKRADEDRMRTESQMITEKEAAMKREHDRQMLLIKQQDESVRKKAQELKQLGYRPTEGKQLTWEGSVD